MVSNWLDVEQGPLFDDQQWYKCNMHMQKFNAYSCYHYLTSQISELVKGHLLPAQCVAGVGTSQCTSQWASQYPGHNTSNFAALLSFLQAIWTLSGASMPAEKSMLV
jgi:hypothetical protein